MKNILCFFIAGIVAFSSVSGNAAVTIKKAASVSAQETPSSSAVNSLVPTVLGLIINVQQLNAKQKELTNECIPSSREITFVDNTMKEWAKTGTMSAKEVESKLKMKPCTVTDGGYSASVKMAVLMDTDDICYDTFSGSGNAGTVWEGYPKVSTATYCADGSNNCSSKDKKTVSNIYDIFNLIDFSTADYTKSEATDAANIMAKIETCSYSKLNAKKRAMWGEFLSDTINSLGQPTSTGTIMEQVSSVIGSSGGGGLGAISSLGAIATQVLGNQ